MGVRGAAPAYTNLNESDDEKPGGERPSGPLGDTFPEFVRYARDRQKRGSQRVSRVVPPPAPRPPSTTHRPALAAAAAVVVFVLVLFAWRGPSGRTGGGGGTAQAITPSAWIDLPRPPKMGEVPDGWGELRLGERKGEIPSSKLAPYTGTDHWADALYRPDPAHPEAFLGISFYHERLYRVAVRYGEDSIHNAGLYLGPAQIAYGPKRGYEYPSANRVHSVTLFQTETRALKLDAVKRPDDLGLTEVVLVDLEMGAARELERARGKQ